MDQRTPLFEMKITAGVGKLGMDITLYEDSFVTVTYLSMSYTKKKIVLFKDIKRVEIRENERGWPRFLTIFLKDGSHTAYDLGLTRVGPEIKAIIDTKLNT